MAIRQKIETGITILLTSGTLVIAASMARESFFRPKSFGDMAVRRQDWRRYAVSDMRIGMSTAPVVITEFSDFQCPVCGRLYQAIERIRSRYGDRSVVLFYRNYPLVRLHPLARLAALAAECVAKQGRFPSYYQRLFERQDSLHQSDLFTVATEVGIADTSEFRKCLTSSRAAQELRADSLAAESLNIPGTPLVLINDRMFRGAPPEGTLDSVVESLIDEAKR